MRDDFKKISFKEIHLQKPFCKIIYKVFTGCPIFSL